MPSLLVPLLQAEGAEAFDHIEVRQGDRLVEGQSLQVGLGEIEGCRKRVWHRQ